MPTNEEITRFHEDPPGVDPYVNGPPKRAPIQIVEYDDRWPAEFERVAARVRAALGEKVLVVREIYERVFRAHGLLPADGPATR